MEYKLRGFGEEDKFSRELALEVLEKAIPKEEIEAVLSETGSVEQRDRKLNMSDVLLIVIGMCMYANVSISHAMRKISQGLRLVWKDPDYRLPGASAISYRRYRLGARPLVSLFHRVCKPVATPETIGAYRFGLRLMAIDGTVEEVPDTPENQRVFGRLKGSRGESAFPQVRGVYLVECGTHAIVDAGFWPCKVSEKVGAFRMLRSVDPGMLVMWDRGLHDYDMFSRVRARGAHVLSRIGSHIHPKRVETFSDGSYLAYIYPSDYKRRKQGEHMLVRVIEYTLTDPALPGYGEKHRLMTTLIYPELYPALDLACCYHERWEAEVVVDEIDTHQRLVGRTLRSLKPVGVIQELYALLLSHYAIRLLIHEAATQAHLDPDRISFVHALRLIQDAIPEFQIVSREDHHRLYSRLLRDIATAILPPRRLRTNPRVVKRKMSKFNLKRPIHRLWPQPKVEFRQAVALI
jgi:hypothetical protein